MYTIEKLLSLPIKYLIKIKLYKSPPQFSIEF